MAEVVAELQERVLPEYEQLKKFKVCTDEQIKECIRKREHFYNKITQREKSMRDYAEFIIYEKKVHKWISEKEKLHGTKMQSLKSSIASRIIRLYREGLSRFPHDERFWENFIQFSKKSVPHEVFGIYEKFLSYHGDKPRVWCDAALWTYEYSMNMKKVKEVFFRALQRHSASEAINKTFFDILLMETSKMSTERNLANKTTSEQDMGLEQVYLIYDNSKRFIFNITYYLRLIERCEEERFRNFTAPLQKAILDDLMKSFQLDESLWDALAQRELRGFNMGDLRSVRKLGSDEVAEQNKPASDSGHETSIDKAQAETNKESESKVEATDEVIKDVWQQRTLKRRIELTCNIYETAVTTLQTEKMWTFYINAMLKLNQDMSTEQTLKRKRLAAAFVKSHECGLMSMEHYCTYLEMLLESSNGIEIAEKVFPKAVKTHKSIRLYELWLQAYISENEASKVLEIFKKVNAEFNPLETLPLWRLTINFFKTRYVDHAKTIKKLYREACQQLIPEFGVFRADYLEFCILNMSIEKTRCEYDELCKMPPPCLELHQKMSKLESALLVRTPADLERWRVCHENAIYYFGKACTQVWIDYIHFERDHGDSKRMTLLYERAKSMLHPDLADKFVSEHTILTSMI